MTGLWPDSLADAITSRSVFAASESFGIVALVLLLLLLLEWDLLAVSRRSPSRVRAVSAVASSLIVVVLLTTGLRLIQLL